MKIEISTNGAKIKWETTAEEVRLAKGFNLSIKERLLKEKEIPASAAESLHKYFLTQGFAVDLEYKDVTSQAKMTYWKHMLVNGPSQISRVEYDKFLIEVGIDLRNIQIEALFKIINSGFVLSALICGTGKTLTTLLQALFFFKRNNKNNLMIIAAPVSCMSEYSNEMQNFRGFFEDMTLKVVYGESVEEMRENLKETNANVIVVSLNSIEKLAKDLQEKIINFDGEVTFVIEEGQNIKEVNSGRSKGAQQVAPLANRVIVNTATPMPKGPTDIRGILSLVGIPQPLDNYTNGIPKRDFETLKGFTFVSDEGDVPYAPLKIEHLDYRDLENLTEKMLAVVSAEIRQNNKVVIFCSTNAGLQRVWDSFPKISKTVLSGSFFVKNCSDVNLEQGRSFEHQQHAIAEFNNNDDCMLLIANYKVGSTGVNLQHSGARVAFFFEISNNGADFFQARYRIRRPFIYPEDGFTYYFARSEDTRKRRTEERQFAKIANQRIVLDSIKSATRSAT
jgi:hypothetical protein